MHLTCLQNKHPSSEFLDLLLFKTSHIPTLNYQGDTKYFFIKHLFLDKYILNHLLQNIFPCDNLFKRGSLYDTKAIKYFYLTSFLH